MHNSLDLAILDTGTTHAVAFARTESRFAAESVPCGAKMEELVQFRSEIDKSLRGEAKRPTDQQLGDFGKRLYELLITGSVRTLFEEVSRSGAIRLHLISNHPTLQSLPWEFLCEPNGVFGPQRDRAVVRVHLGACKQRPTPLLRGTPLRVVLAYAEPRNRERVPWPEVEHKMKVTFQARMPKGISLDVVRAATIEGIQDAVSLTTNPCHILHFLGHGVVRDGKGYVELSDDDLSASELALLVGGCGIQMVVLSACDTSTGAFDADFSVTAETLLVAGIPSGAGKSIAHPGRVGCAIRGGVLSTPPGHRRC